MFQKMTTKAEDLIKLAGEKLKLSDPECKLLRQVVDGKDADYSSDDKKQNDPANADKWNESRTLRAPLILWLCTDREACSYLTHLGLSIKGAKIEGKLKLSYANLEFPLKFISCAFTEQILLDRAKVELLNLSGSFVTSRTYATVTRMVRHSRTKRLKN